MSLNIIENGKILEVQLSGKLSAEDYREFGPKTEHLFQTPGKICILMIMQDFHGWDFGGLWQDIRWDLKHAKHIERIAMVGEKRWQAGMAKVCKPFTSAEIQYFALEDLPKAREWVEEVAEPVTA